MIEVHRQGAEPNSFLEKGCDLLDRKVDPAARAAEAVRRFQAGTHIALANTGLQIHNPNLRNAHGRVFVELFIEILNLVVRTQNFEDRKRNGGHDLLPGIRAVEHHDVRNPMVFRRSVHALL